MNRNVQIAAISSICIGACAYILNGKRKKRRRRTTWMQPWLARRELGNELFFEDVNSYTNFIGMTPELFYELTEMVRNDISKADTRFRQAISAEKRLAVTLRFLATGETFRSLMYSCRIHESTIGKIVPEVCQSIYNKMKDKYLKVPSTSAEWTSIAEGFQCQWNYPLCLGAIDGKHINFVAPSAGGSYFYNYKGKHSIVLLAAVDHEYRFIYVDVGVIGRLSDGVVFKQSSLCRAIQTNSLNFPPPKSLPGIDNPIPYVFVAGDAFPLSMQIMKPYPQRGLDEAKYNFNYRLNRARRVVENAFGILTNRFGVLLTTINLSPQKVETVTLAAVALHNFLIAHKYCPRNSEDEECQLISLPLQSGNRSASLPRNIRDTFKEYFQANPLMENENHIR